MFSRYEARGPSNLQSQNLKNHKASQIHAVAIRFFQNPAAPVLHLLPKRSDDKLLLRGSAPQCEHWLRAWRYGKTPTAYRAAEYLQSTERYVAAHCWDCAGCAP